MAETENKQDNTQQQQSGGKSKKLRRLIRNARGHLAGETFTAAQAKDSGIDEAAFEEVK